MNLKKDIFEQEGSFIRLNGWVAIVLSKRKQDEYGTVLFLSGVVTEVSVSKKDTIELIAKKNEIEKIEVFCITQEPQLAQRINTYIKFRQGIIVSPNHYLSGEDNQLVTFFKGRT